MNKKIIAAVCGLLVSGYAAADDMKYYVGGDLGYNKLGYFSEVKDYVSGLNGTIKSKVPSAGLVAGIKFHENFGAEVGYTFFKKAKAEGANYDANLKLNNLHLDLLGYMPIDKGFDLVGLVGVGRMNLKERGELNGNTVLDEKQNKIGFRLGAGAQYNIDEHFATRLMVKYQKVGGKDNKKFVKHVTSLGLGLTYTI